MDDQTLERIARNEAAFRELNEMLRASATAGDADALRTYTCECGWLGCNVLIELSVAEYEAVRRHPAHFAVAEGHDEPEAERIVLRHERYLVVEKVGPATEVAEALDPRDGPTG